VPAAPPIGELKATRPDVVEEIDRLLEEHPEDEVAALLNERGLPSSSGRPFTASMVKHVCRNHGIRRRYQRLRERGLLTLEEMARRLGVCIGTVKDWREAGRLRGHRYNIRAEYLYEPPTENIPLKRGGK
jgi:DNA-binding transcriptional regulator YiaG